MATGGTFYNQWTLKFKTSDSEVQSLESTDFSHEHASNDSTVTFPWDDHEIRINNLEREWIQKSNLKGHFTNHGLGFGE